MEKNQPPSFFEQVYAVVRRIPEGKVTTYGAIAEFLGSKGSARMVGWALNQSHTLQEPIPAHRVVNRIGLLTGKQHFGQPNVMRNFLIQEGVQIKDNRIVNFAAFFWQPK